MLQFFGLDLKPKLSLGVRKARVGFKPILKKARGFVAAGREFISVVSKSGLGPGMVSDQSTGLHVASGRDGVL